VIGSVTNLIVPRTSWTIAAVLWDAREGDEAVTFVNRLEG
jgi:hypothetical protein